MIHVWYIPGYLGNASCNSQSAFRGFIKNANSRGGIYEDGTSRSKDHSNSDFPSGRFDRRARSFRDGGFDTP